MTNEELCENCGTPRAGQYCQACGQRAIPAGDLTVGHALREAADEVLHLESKTLRSLGRLFNPGSLTADYVSGRRQGQTSPVKLYLICAAIFFLFAPWTGITLAHITSQKGVEALAARVERVRAEQGIDRALFEERFDLRFQTIYTASLSISVAAGALMLAVLFRNAGRPVGAHVVFELHYVAFLYLLAVLTGTAGTRMPGSFVPLMVSLGAIAVYLFIALRRVYGGTPIATAWKLTLMMLVSLVIDSAVHLLAIEATLRTI